MNGELNPDTGVLTKSSADKSRIPVIGLAGLSGSGKTTLAVQIVRRLEQDGKRVAVIKHDGHGHYKEAEGTDSAAYKAAGASAVAVLSPDGLVIYEKRVEPSLEDLLQKFYLSGNSYDLILVEGFKASPIPKIAVVRKEQHIDILDYVGSELLAVAASREVEAGISHLHVPVLELDEPSQVAHFILQYIDEHFG